MQRGRGQEGPDALEPSRVHRRPDQCHCAVDPDHDVIVELSGLEQPILIEPAGGNASGVRSTPGPSIRHSQSRLQHLAGFLAQRSFDPLRKPASLASTAECEGNRRDTEQGRTRRVGQSELDVSAGALPDLWDPVDSTDGQHGEHDGMLGVSQPNDRSLADPTVGMAGRDRHAHDAEIARQETVRSELRQAGRR